MSSLTTKNIEIGFDGREWIQMIREKTNRRISAPVLPKAKEILEKYNDELPRISNQKFNAYLKEIGVFIGINKTMSHHLARRTFQRLFYYLMIYQWKLCQSF
jgi:integrase/recombinase XerD